MALLPSTQETRMVPVAGRQFAERRLIRGVGAAERAVGNAWGRLTSRQREYYGNQRNFAGGLQREATRRASKREEDDDNAQREQGRQDAMGGAPPSAAPKVNHAKASLGKRLSDLNAGQTVSMRNAGQDHAGAEPLRRYGDTAAPKVNTPRPKPASEQLMEARQARRVIDDSYASESKPPPKTATEPPARPSAAQDSDSDNVGRRMALALGARRKIRQTQALIDATTGELNIRETKFKGLKETRGFDMGERPMSADDVKFKRRPIPTDLGPEGYQSSLDWNEKQRRANKFQNSRMDLFEETM